MIAAIRARAAHLGISMSGYIATLIHNDMIHGINAPLLIDTEAAGQPSQPRGVVVEFDLEEE